jgi:hypothetical protein
VWGQAEQSGQQAGRWEAGEGQGRLTQHCSARPFGSARRCAGQVGHGRGQGEGRDAQLGSARPSRTRDVLMLLVNLILQKILYVVQ